MLITPHSSLADPQRHDELRAHVGASRRSGCSRARRVTSSTSTGRWSRRQRPIRPSSRGWLQLLRGRARSERVAAHGGGADAAVAVAHDRAEEVAEGAVQLLDGGLEDLLDVGHAGQPGAELVGEPELARALAQALARARRRRRSSAARAPAAAGGGTSPWRAKRPRLPVLRDARRTGARAPRRAGLLAVQQRAVGAGDELGGADARAPRSRRRRSRPPRRPRRTPRSRRRSGRPRGRRSPARPPRRRR